MRADREKDLAEIMAGFVKVEDEIAADKRALKEVGTFQNERRQNQDEREIALVRKERAVESRTIQLQKTATDRGLRIKVLEGNCEEELAARRAAENEVRKLQAAKRDIENNLRTALNEKQELEARLAAEMAARMEAQDNYATERARHIKSNLEHALD